MQQRHNEAKSSPCGEVSKIKFKQHRWQLIILIALLLSGGAIYTLSNLRNNQWQALTSNSDISHLSLCLNPKDSTISTPMASASKGEPQQPQKVAFKPLKLVVEPWRGEHNVYAIFAVPLAYYEIYYRSIMKVKGESTGWEATIADAKTMKMTAPEGYFLMVSFFRTRLAVWYWLSGRFQTLQDPCNWTLFIYP